MAHFLASALWVFVTFIFFLPSNDIASYDFQGAVFILGIYWGNPPKVLNSPPPS